MSLPNKSRPSLLWALFIFVLAAYYMFVFNSGYGYDALEFLAVGRALHDGMSFFHFSPHKPWALYYLVAGFFSLGIPENHYGVTLLITLIFGSILMASFQIIRRTFDLKTAFLSCFFITLSAIFMEMNFLEAEGLSFLSAIVAYDLILVGLKRNKSHCIFLGGCFIGIGCWFKIVTAVYLPAAMLFIVFSNYHSGPARGKSVLRNQVMLLTGLLSSVVVPCLYFSSRGSLKEYLFWTYDFPFSGYQTFTLWASKLYTRLLWFFVLLFTAGGVSLRKGIRERLYTDDRYVFLLLMGVFPLALLLKSQAPHYLFPAAGFFSVFIAITILTFLEAERSRIRILMAMGLALSLSVVAMSVFLVHSGKISRLKDLTHLRDYSYEQQIASLINEHVPLGARAIYFRDSASLYWITRRYPNIPVFWFDDWATFRLKENPNMLIDALADPNLQIVEFNPDSPGDMDVQDFFLRGHEQNRIALKRFYDSLRTDFIPSDIRYPPYMFWVRKHAVQP
jgi:hypothetical protein